MLRCDYCNSNRDVAKFKYRGKTSQGKKRQTTFKLCLTCQAYGVSTSRHKIYHLWNEDVDENSIVAAGDSPMYAY